MLSLLVVPNEMENSCYYRLGRLGVSAFALQALLTLQQRRREGARDILGYCRTDGADQAEEVMGGITFICRSARAPRGRDGVPSDTPPSLAS